MEFSREIQEAIKKLAGTGGLKNSITITGTVVAGSVDEDNRICSVKTILAEGDLTLTGVHLSAENNDGFIQIPEDESTVLVLRMPDEESYILKFSDIKKLVCFIDSSNEFEFNTNGFIWNGGTFGGIAKTGIVQAKLNVLEAQANAIKAIVVAILAAGTGSPGTPVTNATLAAYFTTFNVTPITPTTQAEISNSKLQH